MTTRKTFGPMENKGSHNPFRELFGRLPRSTNWIPRAPGQVKAALAALVHRKEFDNAEEMAKLDAERNGLKAEHEVKFSQLAAAEKRVEADRLKLPPNPGNPWQLITWVLALGIALVAEYSLTVTTIPFLTGVSEFEWRGIVLGLAPVAAFLVLEIALDFLVETPHRWTQSEESAGHRGRWLARMWVLSFYLGLLVMNIECLRALADAREFILVLKQALTFDQTAMTDFTPTPEYYHAILMLTMTLAVNGAIFALRSSVEFQALNAQAVFNKREKSMKKAQLDLGVLKSRLESSQREIDEGNLPQLVAVRNLEEERARIHQKWQDTWAGMSAEERVEFMCAELVVTESDSPEFSHPAPRIA